MIEENDCIDVGDVLPKKRTRLSAQERSDLARQVQELYCQGYSFLAIQAKLAIRKDMLEGILFRLFRDKAITPQESRIEVVSASCMIKALFGEPTVEYYEVTRDDSDVLMLAPFSVEN